MVYIPYPLMITMQFYFSFQHYYMSYFQNGAQKNNEMFFCTPAFTKLVYLYGLITSILQFDSQLITLLTEDHPFL